MYLVHLIFHRWRLFMTINRMQENKKKKNRYNNLLNQENHKVIKYFIRSKSKCLKFNFAKKSIYYCNINWIVKFIEITQGSRWGPLSSVIHMTAWKSYVWSQMIPVLEIQHGRRWISLVWINPWNPIGKQFRISPVKHYYKNKSG